MGNTSTIVVKTEKFALRIVELYKELIPRQEFVLSRQLLKSGTSIGANVAEAEVSISKKDFLAKMYIAFKECAETKYWLKLLVDTNYITTIEYESIMKDCMEIYKMLSSITKSTKEILDT